MVFACTCCLHLFFLCNLIIIGAQPQSYPPPDSELLCVFVITVWLLFVYLVSGINVTSEIFFHVCYNGLFAEFGTISARINCSNVREEDLCFIQMVFQTIKAVLNDVWLL